MRDKPHVHYLDMGPWPVQVGVALTEDEAQLELERLQVDKSDIPELLMRHASAAVHELVSGRGGVTYLMVFGPRKGRRKAQVAALVAHEATHVMQFMQEELAGGESLGKEAEAYLVQWITQECLRLMWDTKAS